MKGRPSPLSRVALFAGLDSAARGLLEEALRRRAFPAGEVIFHQDDPGDRLYIVLDGRVKICLISEDGREATLAILEQGECFGEMAVLTGAPRSATAIALEDSETLYLRRDDFLGVLHARPSVAVGLLELLSQRLRATDNQVAELAFRDVPGRLARLLLQRAEPGHELQLSQQEMAALIGASRESVNRALAAFRRAGYISVERARVRVLDRTHLARWAPDSGA